MDKHKLNELMKGVGRSRKDAYALSVLLQQGAIVDLKTGRVLWPPYYK